MTSAAGALRVIALAVAAGTLLTGPAAAHVQVRPSHAAPGDAVLWTVLVPSEEQAGTRRVELAVPRDVLPFSFEDATGWTRRLRMNADGSVRSIVWSGRTRPDGLATFRFLASTPEREAAIAWKAIQTYRDGAIVRWIGSATGEHPASITTVSTTAAPENAGGEADTGAQTRAVSASTVTETGQADAAGLDWLARSLAIAALLAAGATTIAARRRR